MRIYSKSRVATRSASNTAKVSLRLSGFLRQHIVPLEDIVQSIGGIPDLHLKGLRAIQYAPEEAPSQACDDIKQWHGAAPKAEYVQRYRWIRVYRFDSSAEFFHILFHEIGHHVFFCILGDRAKHQWVTGLYPQSACITPYGLIDAREDFAETYALYLRDPRQLERLMSAKYHFFESRVFAIK